MSEVTPLTVSDVRHCIYCLRPFTSPRPRRCCSPDCERRVRGKAAYVTRSRRETAAKAMAALQLKLRFVPAWRKVAMGQTDLETHLRETLGVTPTPGPLRHGETLDA